MKENKKNPLVCIIIVNWNGGETIEKCIKSLKITSYPNYRIIVVDNASTDDSIKKLKKINPKIEVIYLDKNYGCSPGRNVAISLLMKDKKMKYICLMDSDIITIQKNWLDVQINELEKKEDYGISGGKLVFPDGRLQVLVRKNRKSFKEKDRNQYNFVTETFAVWGACMIIKRRVIETIGFLDENFFYGPDDVDYCYRAKNAGFKIIYNGFSKSIHVGAFSGLSPKRDYIYRQQAEGMMIYAFRHFNISQKAFMVIRQFIRAFITRKDPFSNQSLKNTIFHKTFLKRIGLFTIALKESLKNNKIIKLNVVDLKGVKFESLKC